MRKGFERTLIILKPDALRRRLAGELIRRFEAKGLGIAGLKLMRVSRPLAAKHYAEHRGKSFYQGLLRFITSGPVIVMAIEGKEAVAVCRALVGATCGRDAAAGTIRGDLGMSNRFNLVHASDSIASARREIALYFARRELLGAEPADLATIYDLSGSEPL